MIVQKENPVLRQITREVPIKDIQSAKIKKIIAQMKKALASQADGVAIAAPQIGNAMRIVIISGKVFDARFRRDARLPDGQKIQKVKNWPPDIALINPKITKLSKEKKWLPEGCLSVRPWWGDVRRSEKTTITAYDETGKKFTRGGSGLLAQIFQHEVDHLDGVLFIDKARNLKKEENLRT
ncbi:hypothetical protein A3B93_01070 [Candidatus Nomurabacteria bacterium RIFCSPHIGHO2_02_FULL_42_24]|uniref:Peptide deformylase n=1 Tax=Candidatus Nomurabacteria bacterium RIFCSPHIGHO2_02_FULL_42_24 TaxID=1801757 RepID=A0A1F6WLD6_9BACT|nr:MAG: hypothetical protein A3B93_01070 [Candidatus Nomurabacteria bacterium RIFCSPHIGHO2_02_FULL_42_24]